MLLAAYPHAVALDHAAALFQAEPCGSRPQCVSRIGAFDMLGNVAEWVKGPRGHELRGCFWAGCFGGTKPTCSFANRAHAGSFRSYEAGFRCCSRLAR
jgi:formylglycine-generating enzyme required for sulfatase activity